MESWIQSAIETAKAAENAKQETTLFDMEIEIRYRMIDQQKWLSLVHQFFEDDIDFEVTEVVEELYEFSNTKTVLRQSESMANYKTPLDRYADPEYKFRCSLSMERTHAFRIVSKYQRENLRQFKESRIKYRIAFKFNHLEVHATTYTSNGNTSYAIELEIMLKSSVNDIMNELIPLHNRILSLKSEKPFYYYVKSQRPMDLTIATLKMEDWLSSAIVTTKADGYKATLVMKDNKIYDNGLCLGKSVHSTNNAIIMHAERVKSTYYIFDTEMCLTYKGRMNFLQSIINSFKVYKGFNILIKKYIKYTSLQELQSFLISVDKRANDGLIFYHPENPYDVNAMKAKVYKWKYTPTIDLYLNDGKVYSREKESLVELDLSIEGLPNKVQGIVECDVENRKITFSKYRPDKKLPNAIQTINNIMSKDSVPEVLLLGQCPWAMLLMRSFNLFKSSIISNQRGQKVLDIGVGNGGDIYKWKFSGLESVTGIEPNINHIQELKQRLSKSGYQDRFILHEGGWETYSFPDEFDSINCFFMMNDIPLKQLNKFFDFVWTKLKQGGSFHTTFLDYSLISNSDVPESVIKHVNDEKEIYKSKYFTIQIDKVNEKATYTLNNAKSVHDNHEESILYTSKILRLLKVGKIDTQILKDEFMTSEEQWLYSKYVYIKWTKT